MDGVLSDTEWIYIEKILEVLQEEGIRIKAEEISDLFGRSMDQICAELKRRYDLPDTAAYYHNRILHLRDRLIEDRGIFPMDGAVELVRDLHNAGIPVAVASSAPIETIKGNMIRFGIEQYIDHFVSGTECVRGKPDP